MISNYLFEEGDLLSNLQFITEFEDSNGTVTDDDTDDEEFAIDNNDEGTAEDTPQTANETPEGVEDNEEEEFTMDDEGEAEPQEQEDETPTDEPEDEDYEIPDEDAEQTPDGEEPPEEGNEDEEFNMDDAGDGEEDTTQDTEDNTMDNDTTADDNIDPRLKELETVIFDDLSEEEKKLKIKDLKELYITVYKKCGTIAELLTDVKRDEETIQIVEYISNTLIDLKQYVNDYINDIFDTKTYVENLAQLQKYIMIFKAINKVFDQIKRENEE